MTSVAFEGTITSSAEAAAAEAGLLQAAAAPGADLTGIAHQLMEVSAQTARLPGLASQAVEIQQAAVDILGRITPVPQDLAFRQLHVDALQTLVQRFIDANRSPEAVAPAEQEIQADRELAATPGADRAAITQTLLALSAQIASGPQPSAIAALDAAQAAADIVGQITPAPQDLAFGQLRADVLHTLTLRYIQASREPEAAAPAAQAVQADRDLAATPGADRAAITQTLLALSAQIASGPQPSAIAALDAAQAAADIVGQITPAPQDLAFGQLRADVLHTLTLRYIQASREPEAAAPAEQAIQADRDLAAIAEVHQVAASLQNLSAALANAGLGAAALDAQQAAVDLLVPAGPPDDRPTAVAEALQTLTVRLVASRHLAEAGTTAQQACEAYRLGLTELRGRLNAAAASLVPVMKEFLGRDLVAQASDVHRLAADALVGEAPPDAGPAAPPGRGSSVTSIARQQILTLQGQVRDVMASLPSLADLMSTAGLGSTQVIGQLQEGLSTTSFCDVDGAATANPHPAGDIRPLTFGPSGGRWTNGHLDVSIDTTGVKYTVGAITPGGATMHTAADVIQHAFTLWERLSFRVAGGFFQFRFVGPGPGVAIRVQFSSTGPKRDFAGPDGMGVLGRGEYPPNGNVYFDSNPPWTASGLFPIALHEIGHALGFTHCDTPGATMYPFNFGQAFIDDDNATKQLRAMYGWTPQMHLPDRAVADRVALAVTSETTLTSYIETPQMVWKGGGDDTRVFYSEFRGNAWTPQQPIDGIGSSHTPVLIQIPVPGAAPPVTGLLMAWKGAGNDQGIYWTRNIGSGWEPQRNIPNQGTSQPPALASLNGTIVMAWKGIEGDTHIYTATFDGVQTWTPPPWSPLPLAGRGTSTSPSMIGYNGQLYMFWKGIDDDDSVWYAVFPAGDPNPIWRPQQQVIYFTYDTNGGIPQAIGTTAAPSVTLREDAILLAWKGAEGDSAIYTSLFQDGEYSGQIHFASAGTATGPSVVRFVSRTIGSDQPQESVLMAWRGAGSDKTIWFARI